MNLIRTLGLYQPYASLMLHGKIESRWVENGKKPPFPLGTYLIYSTKKEYTVEEFRRLSGQWHQKARNIISREETSTLTGHALALGELTQVKKLTQEEKSLAYIDFDIDENNDIQPYTLWGLHFTDVRRIKPFLFKGKQGIGFLKEEQKKLIKFV